MLTNRLSTLYKTILKNFIRKDVLDKTLLDDIDPKNPRNFRLLEEIYLGPKVNVLLASENVEQRDLHQFKIKCLDFYTELSSQIRKRFSFKNKILHFCSYFNPKDVIAGKKDSIVVESTKYFPSLITDVNSLNFE